MRCTREVAGLGPAAIPHTRALRDPSGSCTSQLPYFFFYQHNLRHTTSRANKHSIFINKSLTTRVVNSIQVIERGISLFWLYYFAYRGSQQIILGYRGQASQGTWYQIRLVVMRENATYHLSLDFYSPITLLFLKIKLPVASHDTTSLNRMAFLLAKETSRFG
jgi:hypothetical protein